MSNVTFSASSLSSPVFTYASEALPHQLICTSSFSVSFQPYEKQSVMTDDPTLTPASAGSVDPEINPAPETDLKMEVKKEEEEEVETQEEEVKVKMEAVQDEVKVEENPEVRESGY